MLWTSLTHAVAVAETNCDHDQRADLLVQVIGWSVGFKTPGPMFVKQPVPVIIYCPNMAYLF